MNWDSHPETSQKDEDESSRICSQPIGPGQRERELVCECAYIFVSVCTERIQVPNRYWHIGQARLY